MFATIRHPRRVASDLSEVAGPTVRPRSRWTLPLASGAGFLAGVDTTAVNLALPDLQRDLHAGLTELQWVVNAFALLSATLLVLAGNLSDRFGARRVFLLGVLGFAGSSALCGLAWSALALDVARAAQGATSAVVTAGGLALLAGSYPASERGRALGLYSSVAALSFVVGPLAGGVLTDAFGWRSVFMANVPLAAVIVLGVACAMPEPERPDRVVSPARFDPAGVAAFVVGLAGVQYAAMRAGDPGASIPEVLLVAAIGVVGLVVFVLVERGAPTPSSIWVCSGVGPSPGRPSRSPWPLPPSSACSSTSACSCSRRRATARWRRA